MEFLNLIYSQPQCSVCVCNSWTVSWFRSQPPALSQRSLQYLSHLTHNCVTSYFITSYRFDYHPVIFLIAHSPCSRNSSWPSSETHMDRPFPAGRCSQVDLVPPPFSCSARNLNTYEYAAFAWSSLYLLNVHRSLERRFYRKRRSVLSL